MKERSALGWCLFCWRVRMRLRFEDACWSFYYLYLAVPHYQGQRWLRRKLLTARLRLCIAALDLLLLAQEQPGAPIALTLAVVWPVLWFLFMHH
jgi:hypothetical protein